MTELPEVARYLTYGDVFGSSPTRDELGGWLAALSLDDVLQTTGKLSSALLNPMLAAAALDLTVARWIPNAPDRARAEARIAAGERLLFDSRLATLARVAMAAADRRPADGMGGGTDVPLFVRAHHGDAALYQPPGAFAGDDPAAIEDEISRLMLRRLATKPSGSMAAQLTRYWRMFVDLPADRPELLEQGEDLDERMRAEVGMSVRRYLAISFGLFIRFGSWNPDRAAEQGWTIDASYWQKTTVTEQEYQAVVGALSATPTEFVDAFTHQEKQGFDAIDDLRPFALHPLCEIEPGHVLPVDVEALASRLFGDGIYWRLRPQGGSTQTEQLDQTRFGATVGRLLEDHLLDVARSVYPVATGAAERLFGETSYGGNRGVDLAILDGGESVFVEIGTNRADVLRTIFRGDLASYEKDIVRVLLPRAEQLQRKIHDARAGDLRLGDHKPDELGLIHPVVCLIDGFPLGPTLRERIERALEKAGLLQDPQTGRLAIASPDELEALLSEVERQGSTMSSLLSEAAFDSETRLWNLRDFLIARRGGLARTTFVEKEWQRITPLLAAEFFGNQGEDPSAS